MEILSQYLLELIAQIQKENCCQSVLSEEEAEKMLLLERYVAMWLLCYFNSLCYLSRR